MMTALWKGSNILRQNGVKRLPVSAQYLQILTVNVQHMHESAPQGNSEGSSRCRG